MILITLWYFFWHKQCAVNGVNALRASLILHFYFLFSFTFFLPFLLTFLTFLVVQTVRCQLCQHPGGFVAVPRFMGLCSPGEKPGKTIMWNILFVSFVCVSFSHV